MIRKNIDVSKSLVNGTIGTPKSVTLNLDKSNIEEVIIELKDGNLHTLERCKVKFQVIKNGFNNS